MEYRPIARSSDLVVQEAGDETLVYDLKTNKASCLNETSSTIWKLCDGKRSMVDISIELSAKFKSNIEEELVWLALDQLKKEKLLQDDGGQSPVLNRTSRRELIKKVGFAAVVAIPIVSSVVAPSAANSASLILCSGTSSDQEGCVCSTSSGNNGAPSCQAGCNAAKTLACGAPRTCAPNEIQCVAGSSGQCLTLPNNFKCCDYGTQGGMGGFNC